MPRPRVLVVDDSVVARRLVSKAIADHGAVDVVGVAADGRAALAQIERLRPDAVTLDVDMPVMDGLETVEAIRERWPHLVVIMFSTYTARGAQVTLDALALGANDYVVKPSGAASPSEAMTRIREELLPRILALCPHSAAADRGTTQPAAALTPIAPPSTGPTARVDAIAIGISTGGPTALGSLLGRLSSSLPVPILIVQHMPPMFTRVLAERLDRTCPIHVVEAADRHALEPGTASIAPGDRHMSVERSGEGVRIRTGIGPRENSCRPSADPLFRSVAEIFGSHALGIVMTGMGNDGLRGAYSLHEAGARVIVQDEASSVVWGMPGFVVRSGLADAIVPLDELPGEIGRRLTVGRSQQTTLRPVGVGP
jgi:two-component system chemotaxis response regulator CheB